MSTNPKTNLSALADAYATAKGELSDLEAKVAKIRSEILDTEYASILGTKCRVTIEHRSVRRLSADLVASFLTPEQFEKCFKPSMSAIVRVKPR